MAEASALRNLLNHAALKGYTFKVVADDGTVDYEGSSVREAFEAVEACGDPLTVRMIKAGEKTEAALVTTHGVDPEEQVIDYVVSPFMDGWFASI